MCRLLRRVEGGCRGGARAGPSSRRAVVIRCSTGGGVRAACSRRRIATQRRIALCVCCDIAEHCGEAALPVAEHFMPAMMAFADPAQPAELRQAAVYGLGVCAAGEPGGRRSTGE